MQKPDSRSIRANGAVGAFLVLSGASFAAFLGEDLYATLCICVGGLFLAKALADYRVLIES